MEATALHFAAVARTLGGAARARGLVVPAFRSPPRRPGASRTLRRWPGGGATVSVEVTGRPREAVVADMVEGVVVVNGVTGPDATRLRTLLWEAVLAASTASAEAA
ncbi:hypothetical protein HC251_06550 [Iamia sp. SCSIO 61187]|uniref:hypothetical protein n=1 Tax=Iamia sp. SCSIO 61187 TaxID=2722752 RepID=UPI001C62FD1D|nr:hypothetical protein [Iamia sp. SCSIO 61187]QYG92133.1 hypothetical protein HC251_06550 [Iamia sp. SCSIO 61187]